MKTYYGVADCYGIESFFCLEDLKREASFKMLSGEKVIEKPEESFYKRINNIYFRARANEHRHAVVYSADLDEVDSDKIESLLKKEQFIEALRYLKKHAIVLKETRKGAMKRIPNPYLDPYYEKH